MKQLLVPHQLQLPNTTDTFPNPSTTISTISTVTSSITTNTIVTLTSLSTISTTLTITSTTSTTVLPDFESIIISFSDSTAGDYVDVELDIYNHGAMFDGSVHLSVWIDGNEDGTHDLMESLYEWPLIAGT
ncbi:MAG: hypothetical protein ACOCWM_06385 [Cyclobacteriaceae bacterium]